VQPCLEFVCKTKAFVVQSANKIHFHQTQAKLRRDDEKELFGFHVGGILLAVGVTATLSQATNPLDPLKVCPDTHKLLFENAVHG